MKIFILELFFIIYFCHIFNSGLVTPTTEMETKYFVVKKCRISSQSSFIRTLRCKFLGLDRAFSTYRYSWIQRGVHSMK
ncbi:Immunoglobulin-like domain-containing protein, partial [Cynara cardunculus var. scolymus]